MHTLCQMLLKAELVNVVKWHFSKHLMGESYVGHGVG